MSSQSGISVSAELNEEFPSFLKSNDVAAVLTINHEKEHVDLHSRVNGTEISDVRTHLGDGTDAHYIILRLAEPTEFAFILYMPDSAPLRAKMKYASSHATIFRNLGGSSVFKTTIFWTNLDEVSDEGLKAHELHEAAPAPHTEEEESLKNITLNEKLHGTKGSSVAGQSQLSIDAHVSEEAETKIKQLGNDQALIFSVKTDSTESTELDSEVAVSSLASELENRETPCFVYLKYNNKTLFSFVCPRTATIKQRMIYASTRLSFQNYLNQNGHVDATIETYQPETDLTVKAIEEEIGTSEPEPVQKTVPKFSKPKPLRRSRPK